MKNPIATRPSSMRSGIFFSVLVVTKLIRQRFGCDQCLGREIFPGNRTMAFTTDASHREGRASRRTIASSSGTDVG
jgi:hypothetical protein